MKNKKSLLSVLLAAVLLCACVAGMLIFGANAENAVTTYYVDESSSGTVAAPAKTIVEGEEILTFKTIRDATAYAKARKGGWEANEELSIKLLSDVAFTKDSNYVFVLSTVNRIEKNDHTGLHITISSIDPSAPKTITINPQFAKDANGNLIKDDAGEPVEEDSINNLNFVNDYTVSDVKLNIRKTFTIYNGDRLEFYNVEVTDGGAGSKVYCTTNTFGSQYITADNYSKKVDENGRVCSEIILSGNTSFPSTVAFTIMAPHAGADWYKTENIVEGKEPILVSNVDAKLTLNDNASIAGSVTALGTNDRGSAYLEMTGGSINGNTFMASSGRTLKNNNRVVFDIMGGTTKAIWGCYISSSTGTINIASGSSLNLNVSGTGKTGALYLMNVQHSASMTLAEGAEFNVNVSSGATVGSITGAYATSDNYATGSAIVNGKINIDIAGTVGNVALAGKNAKINGEISYTYSGADTSNTITAAYGSAVVSGAIKMIANSSGTMSGAIVGASGSTTVKDGGEISLTQKSGTVSGVCALGDGADFSVESGATLSLSVEGGSFITKGRNWSTTAGVILSNTTSKANALKGTDQCLKSGSLIKISVSNGTIGSGSYSTFFRYACTQGDVELNITGGTFVANLRLFYESYIGGNLTINIDVSKSGKALSFDAYVPDYGSYVAGETITTVDGGAEKKVSITDYHGAVGALKTENTVSNAVLVKYNIARSSTLAKVSKEEYAAGAAALIDIKNVVKNCKITTFYGTQGSYAIVTNVHGTVTNEIYGSQITTFYGGYGSATNSSYTANIVNTIGDFNNTATTIKNFYAGSRTCTKAGEVAEVGTISTEINGKTQITGEMYVGCYSKGDTMNIPATVKTLLVNGGTFSVKLVDGDITINGGTFNKSITGSSVTIKGGTFKGNVTGDKVILAGGTIYSGARDNTITATEATAVTTIKRLTNDQENILHMEGQNILTIPSWYADKIDVDNNDTIRGYMWLNEEKLANEGKVVVESKLAELNRVVLDITDRVVIKVLLPKAEVAIAKTHSGKNFSYYCVALGITKAKMVTIEWDKIPVYNDEYYYFELPAIGAGSFDTELSITTSVFDAITKQSVSSIATQGAEYYADSNPEAADLFAALVDYGNAAKGTLETLTAGVEVDKNDILADPSATPGSGAVQFKSMTLLMGDTIGIRLNVDLEKTTGSVGSVWLHDTTDVTDLCRLDAQNGTLDLFVNAKNFNTKLKITVKDSDGNDCLILVNSVKNIANQLANQNSENINVQAVLQLIQATQNYVATLSQEA